MAKLFPDLSRFTEQEIIDILEGQCEGTQETTFERAFSKDEIDEMKTDLPDKLVNIKTRQEELKLLKAQISAEIRAQQLEADHLVSRIQKKSHEVTEQLYKIPDFDTNLMDFYDQKGNIIMSRPLLPHERQLRIGHKATGTNE